MAKVKNYTSYEANELFSFVKEFVDLRPEKFKKITKADVVKNPDLLEELEGYKVRYTRDGSHKNDGQMVEYTFDFESPKGAVTSITTEMCLMVDWNHCEDISLK